MKKVIFKVFHLGLLTGLIVLIFNSCWDLFSPPQSNTEQFLVGCEGNDAGLEPGLYKYEVGKTPEFITSYLPYAKRQYLMDYNKGIIAYRVDPTPENTSGVAYMDINDLKDIRFTPIPEASEGYYFSIGSSGPKVFDDGRIAYLVYYETENPYDDYRVGMIAIYNPSSEDLELSGNPSSFVLSQPEKGYDTEGGSMEGPFVISPDNNYLYCNVFGAGTDAGVYHEDYHFIVRYTVGEPGSYSRIVQIDGGITAITSDGNYLIFYDTKGLNKIDLSTNEIINVDNYLYEFLPGNVSPSGSKMIKSWPDGIGEYDFSIDPVKWLGIMDSKNLPKKIMNAQYNSEGNKIYFAISNDIYCHNESDTYIYSAEIKENNETPDSIGYLAPEFCTKIFLKL